MGTVPTQRHKTPQAIIPSLGKRWNTDGAKVYKIKIYRIIGGGEKYSANGVSRSMFDNDIQKPSTTNCVTIM